MASPESIQVDNLLAPVSAEVPAGADLRLTREPGSPYDTARSARSQAGVRERKLAGGEDVPPPDWKAVRDGSVAVLEKHSKDMEICAWLIEGLVRVNGFAGLRDGLRVAVGLVERFWDALNPRPEPDDPARTVSALAGLLGGETDGTLLAPIYSIPLTQGDGYARWQFQYASEHESDAAPAEGAGGAAVPVMSAIRTAAGQTEAQFFIDLVEDIEQCRQQLSALSTVLDERCRLPDGQSFAPSGSRIAEALTNCLDVVKELAKDKLPSAGGSPADGEQASADGAAASTSATPSAGGGGGGPLNSREDALRMLDSIAAFLRRLEPHSPVSYLIERAVRLGRMPLPALLEEMIEDSGSRTTLCKLTGVPEKTADSPAQ